MGPLASIFELNTDLLRNCLEGMSEPDMLARVDTVTNHAAFLTAHLVGARAYLAGALGGDGTDPFEETLGGDLSIDDVDRFPSLGQLHPAWDQVTRNLVQALEAAEPSLLDQAAPAAFPVDDGSVLGMIAFLAQHESYHIGQLALLRKHLGHGAMSYQRGESE